MTDRTPTSEQQAILAFAKSQPANLLVNALAGTGKTSTIEMVCCAITDRAILYLAFNKRIVDEAKARMPSHVECRTQNSLGHSVWAAAIGRRLAVDTDKNRNIIRLLINELPRKAQEQAWDEFADTNKWMQRAKRDGYVPSGFAGAYRRLYDGFDDWASRYDETPSDQQCLLLQQALLRNIEAAYAGGIDYDDQIYMPVVFGGPWPKYRLVVVDEVQDYNPLGHEMLAKLLHERIIAVGDPWQSIYAFRGAMLNGMSAMAVRFGMAELPLSVTFRVPKLGVERARSRVPQYEAYHANIEGEICVLGSEDAPWTAADIPDDAAIICRNNAPLISLAFRLLRSGRAVKMVGFDIGASLVRTLKKLGPPTFTEAQTRFAIDQWLSNALSTTKKAETAYDRAECLRALVEGKPTLGDAIVMADQLFKSQKGVNLLSGHKSKGLEWDTVFHLDPWRIPSPYALSGEALEQELNVRYVIETRFKRKLVLINMEHYDHATLHSPISRHEDDPE